jgi:transposase InsO family protein
MSTHTSFDIARYTNRNGTPSWRISGWLHGVRIRRNFKSREEAAVQKSVLEIRAAQAAAGLRQTTTFLADPQLREAEDTFRRLEGIFRRGVQRESIRCKPFAPNSPNAPRETSVVDENADSGNECLNSEVFLSIADAHEKLERWRHDYNHLRPHSSLPNRPPAEYARVPCGNQKPTV